ncbi:UPF0481 protein [Glycine soja]|nr:UPF0481 protein [Glycine soja]
MEEEANHHAIDISNIIDRERLASMELKISENPKFLCKAAGKRSCCIFRVPQSLVEVNGKAYQPRIVSIGPYHRNQPRLNMIEEHKWRYLESEARECYSETINLDSHDFIQMMILDGCFIIELFRKVARLVPFEREDPLLTMVWILPFFYRDFLKLENQIPFFILNQLYQVTKLPGEKSTPTLSTLALLFFNNSLQKPDESLQNDVQGKHLLDLVRSSFIPKNDEETEPRKRVMTPTHVILCVSKLRRAGIKINPSKESESFLNVKFRRGVIEMPSLTVDDFMSSFLLNCVALEQCYSDVEYLCDRNVVENHLGTEGEVASFINNAGKDVAVDLDLCYLSRLFNDVHKYYINSWHVQWASFKHTYFDTPWSFISLLAASILLLLTVAQTYFSASQYFHQT